MKRSWVRFPQAAPPKPQLRIRVSWGSLRALRRRGGGQIRAGSSILRACRVGRSAGRRWPGLLAFSMHAEVSPWLMYWLLKLIQLPENVAQLSLGINMHDYFLEVRKTG